MVGMCILLKNKLMLDKLSQLGVQSSNVPTTKKGRKELLTKLLKGGL